MREILRSESDLYFFRTLSWAKALLGQPVSNQPETPIALTTPLHANLHKYSATLSPRPQKVIQRSGHSNSSDPKWFHLGEFYDEIPGDFVRLPSPAYPARTARLTEANVPRVSSRHPYAVIIARNARSTAAMAWIVVVSKSGTALSSSETRSMISVQPRMIACAPSPIRLVIILRYKSRDLGSTIPYR